MAIQFRGTKGSSLTHNELDQNFREFFYSASYEGSNLKLHKFTSISSSINVPLTNPVGRNGAIQFKLGNAVSGANAQFTGSSNLVFANNHLKITGSVLIDASAAGDQFDLTGSAKITDNLTVGGTLTAEEFVTERNTTIQIYNSGSTIFGDSADDIHERTGSLKVDGNFHLFGSGSVTSLSGSFSGSLQGEGSGVTGIISSSHAVNADIAPFGGLTGRPTLVSSSIQLASDITGSFTLTSSSIATSLDARITTASVADRTITFTKGNGSTFNLTVNTGSDSTGITSVLADTTPQLGGNLDLNSNLISGSGGIDIVSGITGSNFAVGEYIKHDGDDNTYVRFLNDRIILQGGFGNNVDVHSNGNIYVSGSSSIFYGGISATNTISGSVIKSANAISGSSLLIDGTIKATGDVTAFHSSDERLKDNVTPIEGAIDKINQIGGYGFDWNDNSEHSGHDVGVIAQEIEKVLPEVVVTRDNGYKAVRYEKIVALLINAIKEQQLQIDELKSKL